MKGVDFVTPCASYGCRPLLKGSLGPTSLKSCSRTSSERKGNNSSSFYYYCCVRGPHNTYRCTVLRLADDPQLKQAVTNPITLNPYSALLAALCSATIVSTLALIRRNPTRNSALQFRGNKKFGSGYTKVSVEYTRDLAWVSIPVSYERAGTVVGLNGHGKPAQRLLPLLSYQHHLDKRSQKVGILSHIVLKTVSARCSCRQSQCPRVVQAPHRFQLAIFPQATWA